MPIPILTHLPDTAEEIEYDPAASGLTATEVQSALDSLAGLVAQGGGGETAQGTWPVARGGIGLDGDLSFTDSAPHCARSRPQPAAPPTGARNL